MKYRVQLISVRGVEVVWLDSQGREGGTDKKEMQDSNEIDGIAAAFLAEYPEADNED